MKYSAQSRICPKSPSASSETLPPSRTSQASRTSRSRSHSSTRRSTSLIRSSTSRSRPAGPSHPLQNARLRAATARRDFGLAHLARRWRAPPGSRGRSSGTSRSSTQRSVPHRRSRPAGSPPPPVAVFQNSVNLSGVRNAPAVRARISRAAAVVAMSVSLRESFHGDDSAGSAGSFQRCEDDVMTAGGWITGGGMEEGAFPRAHLGFRGAGAGSSGGRKRRGLLCGRPPRPAPHPGGGALSRRRSTRRRTRGWLRPASARARGWSSHGPDGGGRNSIPNPGSRHRSSAGAGHRPR